MEKHTYAYLILCAIGTSFRAVNISMGETRDKVENTETKKDICRQTGLLCPMHPLFSLVLRCNPLPHTHTPFLLLFHYQIALVISPSAITYLWPSVLLPSSLVFLPKCSISVPFS